MTVNDSDGLPDDPFDPALLADTDDPWNLIDWTEFWDQEHNPEEWLIEPVIAAGRGHAIIAKGGAGKSLLALWLAARTATGQGCFGGPHPPIGVLYLDYEMTADDLAERLETMGYGPDSDLTHLHYALLPAIASLDDDAGGMALAVKAHLLDVQLVVIDTYARAVAGDENEADTVRAFYRATATQLKRHGIALARIDHLGKDATLGARGSSAKNDDVDIVWQLEARDDNQYTLRATKRRANWVPETVSLIKHEDPVLRYTIIDGAGWPAGTLEVAVELDRLGLPVDVTGRAAAAAYRDAGGSARNSVVFAAVKYRRAQTTITLSVDKSPQPVEKAVDIAVDTCSPTFGEQESEKGGEQDPRTPGSKMQNPWSQAGTIAGSNGEQGPERMWGAEGVPIKGPPSPHAAPEPPNDDEQLFP